MITARECRRLVHIAAVQKRIRLRRYFKGVLEQIRIRASNGETFLVVIAYSQDGVRAYRNRLERWGFKVSPCNQLVTWSHDEV